MILEGHADHRGSTKYNKELTDRRADRVKNGLVENGIPAANIETRGLGKEDNLKDKEVLALLDQNPNVTPGRKEACAEQSPHFPYGQQPPRGRSAEHHRPNLASLFPLEPDDLKSCWENRRAKKKAQ